MSLSEQDILNQLNEVDLSKVETSFPILAGGVVPANITDCKFVTEDSKKRQGEKNVYLLVNYALAQPWKTVAHEGIPSKPINPGDRGSAFNERIYVGKTIDDKTGEEKWYGLDRIAKLREAVFGRAAEGSRIVPAELIGQTVTLTLKFEEAPKNKDTGETYGPRTSVSGYVRKK